MFFLGRQYATLEIRGVALGRHVGHDSCCCSAVSEPANGLSKLVSARGRCGRSFVFLGRQYATLEIRGAALGRHVGHDSCCCSAVSEPANGLSKLVSARGRCGIRLVFLGRQYATLEIRGAALGRHVGHESCCCSAVSEPANGLSKLVPAMGRCGIRPSQNELSKLVPAMGRCGIRLVFLGRQYATLEIRGVALGRHVGHDSCCCSAVSEPANGLSKLVSARGRCGRSFVFLGRQYATLEIRGAALGRHVGHDSCCCSAVSEPANGLSKLVSARGRCGIRLVFLGRQYATLEIRGAALGRHVGHESCCCSAVSEPANGLSKLVPAMGRCGIRPSQNGLSKLVPAMGRCGIRLVFLGRQYATLEIRGVALGRHVGHDSCCCSAVSEPANGLSKLVSARGRCGRSFVFLGRQYATLEIRGAALGRHVGHDSCCCSAVSEPANGLSKLVSARGRCGIRLVFLGRQYATLEIRGAALGRHVGHDSCCCLAVSEPANGLSKLVSARGRCGIRLVFLGRQYATLEIRGAALGRHVGHESCCCSAVSEPANGLSKLVSARGRCGIRLVFLGRQYATLEIRGAALGRHVGHDSCCCSAVSEPANGLSKLVSARGRCGIRLVFLGRQYATLEIRGSSSINAVPHMGSNNLVGVGGTGGSPYIYIRISMYICSLMFQVKCIELLLVSIFECLPPRPVCMMGM